MATTRAAIRISRQEGRALFMGSAPKVQRPKPVAPLPDLIVLRAINSFTLEGLPIPPSINNSYINVPGIGRAPSKKLKAWKQSAGLLLNAQRISCIVGNYKVRIYVPTHMRGDIDNRAKFLIDLFVSLELTPDDRFCDELTIMRFPNIPTGACVVDVVGNERR